MMTRAVVLAALPLLLVCSGPCVAASSSGTGASSRKLKQAQALAPTAVAVLGAPAAEALLVGRRLAQEPAPAPGIVEGPGSLFENATEPAQAAPPATEGMEGGGGNQGRRLLKGDVETAESPTNEEVERTKMRGGGHQGRRLLQAEGMESYAPMAERMEGRRRLTQALAPVAIAILGAPTAEALQRGRRLQQEPLVGVAAPPMAEEGMGVGTEGTAPPEPTLGGVGRRLLEDEGMESYPPMAEGMEGRRRRLTQEEGIIERYPPMAEGTEAQLGRGRRLTQDEGMENYPPMAEGMETAAMPGGTGRRLKQDQGTEGGQPLVGIPMPPMPEMPEVPGISGRGGGRRLSQGTATTEPAFSGEVPVPELPKVP